MALLGLTEKLTYLSEPDIRRVERAYRYAERSHTGQVRQTGDLYITHPLAVANILADMHMDPEGLMAAMLHDVIEDTGVTKGQISRRFGRTVADIVVGVSKLNEIEFVGIGTFVRWPRGPRSVEWLITSYSSSISPLADSATDYM